MRKDHKEAWPYISEPKYLHSSARSQSALWESDLSLALAASGAPLSHNITNEGPAEEGIHQSKYHYGQSPRTLECPIGGQYSNYSKAEFPLMQKLQ